MEQFTGIEQRDSLFLSLLLELVKGKTRFGGAGLLRPPIHAARQGLTFTLSTFINLTGGESYKG